MDWREIERFEAARESEQVDDAYCSMCGEKCRVSNDRFPDEPSGAWIVMSACCQADVIDHEPQWKADFVGGFCAKCRNHTSPIDLAGSEDKPLLVSACCEASIITREKIV